MNKKQTALGAIIATLIAGSAAAGYGYTVIRDNQADIFESSIHRVISVVDGDTFDIENDVRIRLIGIDAPERAECGYDEAKDFLTLLLADAHINIEKDITGADVFDRLLRYAYIPSDDIMVDDVLVNLAVLRAGYAKTLAVAPDNRYRDLFASAQDEAKREGRGLWPDCLEPDDDSWQQADIPPPNESCVIKGNVSGKSYGHNYFLEGCPNYNRIKIDPSKGEAYFCTEAEAIAAGFTKSISCASTGA